VARWSESGARLPPGHRRRAGTAGSSPAGHAEKSTIRLCFLDATTATGPSPICCHGV